MYRLLLLVPVILVLSLTTAQASGTQTTNSFPVQQETFKQPDLISFGLAYDDFDKSETHRQSGDLRAEYRWGLSMLPLISPWFKSWDRYVQFHPFAGVELGTLGQIYGLGGWAMDAYFGHHVVLTWSEGVGLYYGGDSVRLGSVIEFRSMAELGWRFDNEMRLTGQISHISNAKITEFNPGSEFAGIYFHVPASMILGGK